MTSRTQVARYIANGLSKGSSRQEIIAMAAAWLKQSGRERQVNYLVKDVVYELAKGDYVFAKVTTARDVSAATKSEVESYIVKQTGAKTVECQFSIDPSLIGGAVIETPHGVIDDSVKSKLLQIVEGVS